MKLGRINLREENVFNSQGSKENNAKALSEALEEINRLKKEIDRLSKNNSELKEELARLIATESGLGFLWRNKYIISRPENWVL